MAEPSFWQEDGGDQARDRLLASQGRGGLQTPIRPKNRHGVEKCGESNGLTFDQLNLNEGSYNYKFRVLSAFKHFSPSLKENW